MVKRILLFLKRSLNTIFDLSRISPTVIGVTRPNFQNPTPRSPSKSNRLILTRMKMKNRTINPISNNWIGLACTNRKIVFDCSRLKEGSEMNR